MAFVFDLESCLPKANTMELSFKTSHVFIYVDSSNFIFLFYIFLILNI